MELKTLSPAFSATAQISPDDMAAIKAAGFRAIICNRPDDEDDGQPEFAVIAKAAKAAGLDVAHVPVIPGQITDADVAAFDAALDRMTGPVLGYCRSGGRAAMLWSLRAAQHAEPDTVALPA